MYVPKILILGNNESSIATMSDTNILRRSEMQMISTETKLHLYKYAVLPNSTNNLTNLINILEKQLKLY